MKRNILDTSIIFLIDFPSKMSSEPLLRPSLPTLQSFDNYAINKRIDRFNMRAGNLRTMIILATLLAEFSLIILCMISILTSISPLPLVFVFAINVGCIAVFCMLLMARTCFELQVDKFDAMRCDFPILSWFGILESLATTCVLASILFLGWGVIELLDIIDAIYAIPLTVMVILFSIALFIPFSTLLPPAITQRPSLIWAHNVSGNPEEKFDALHYAAISGDWFAVQQLLIDTSFNINTQVEADNSTLLHIMIRMGYDFIADRLIERKATINIQNSDGNNVLHEAVIHTQWNILNSIMNNYENSQLHVALIQKNNKGQTPTDIATLNGIPLALQKRLLGKD